MSGNGRAKRQTWSQCESVSELANLIDALPPQLRLPVLQAAFSFNADDDIGNSYLIGIFRNQLFDSVIEFNGLRLNVIVAELPRADLTEWLRRFAKAKDLAQVQLVVCDLLEFIDASIQDGCEAS